MASVEVNPVVSWFAPSDPLSDLFPVNDDILGCVNAESYLVTEDFRHGDDDIVSDENPLTDLTRKNEHGSLRKEFGSVLLFALLENIKTLKQAIRDGLCIGTAGHGEPLAFVPYEPALDSPGERLGQIFCELGLDKKVVP